jgi:hypothetical protein
MVAAPIIVQGIPGPVVVPMTQSAMRMALAVRTTLAGN